jgi:hypothetical protein
MLRALLAVLVAVSVAACSGDDGASTTTLASEGDVVLGSGTLPDTVPDDFPIPPEAVIGSTLVAVGTGTTEVILRLPSSIEASIVYFEQRLDIDGYDVVSSEAESGTSWSIEFERDDLTGSLRLSSPGTDVTEVVLTLQQ